MHTIQTKVYSQPKFNYKNWTIHFLHIPKTLGRPCFTVTYYFTECKTVTICRLGRANNCHWPAKKKQISCISSKKNTLFRTLYDLHNAHIESGSVWEQEITKTIQAKTGTREQYGELLKVSSCYSTRGAHLHTQVAGTNGVEATTVYHSTGFTNGYSFLSRFT